MEVFATMQFLKRNNYQKELKQLKKQERIAKITRYRVKTTLDWCDISSLSDEGIFLKGKKPIGVKGIKVDPKNILIMDSSDQASQIDNLRLALNKLKFEFFIAPIKLNINIAEDQTVIIEALKNESDPKRIKLFEDDLDKLYELKTHHRQIEFHLYVRDANPKILEKKFMDLYNEMSLAKLYPTKLQLADYKNYINYLFENPLLNDFYFSSGIFDWNHYQSKHFLSDDDELSKYELTSDDEEFLSMGNDDTLTLLSKLVPTSYHINKDYLIIGDRYVSNILVTQLPYTFNLGLLSNFVSLPDTKMMIKINQFQFDLNPAIKKDYNQKLDEYNKTSDPTLKARLEKELIAVNNYLDRSTSNNDATFNTIIIFSIYADSFVELKEKTVSFRKKLKAEGFNTFNGLIMQDQLFRLANPIMHRSHLPKEVEDGLGVPLQTEGVAGLYPFIYDRLKDKGGMVLGKELANGGAIIFNPFFYVEQKDLASASNRVSGNMIVVGKTGSGKTTLMNLIVRYLIRCQRRIFWIDPENKNKRLTRHYSGSYIEYGKRGNVINPFDLQPITFDDDSGVDDLSFEELEAMYDTDLAIDKAIENISIILNYLFKEYSDEESSVVGKMIRKTYHRVGISPGIDGKYQSFKDLEPKDYPTFSDLKTVIEEELIAIKDDSTKQIEIISLNKINIKLEKIIGQWSIYLNGHTTIPTDSKILSFGTKALYELSDELKSALRHIINSYAWSICVKSKEPAALVHDEAHVDMADFKSAEELSQESRRSRKYNTVLLLGTQEPKDFADSKVSMHGKAIFNNSAYKFIMNLDKDPVNDLSELITLNESEKYFIEHRFTQGDCLFICGNHNLAINVWATPSELKEI